MIVVNNDGEVETVEDTTEYFNLRPKAEIDLSRRDYTPDEKLAWKQSHAEYKERLARKGVCPYNSTPCRRASVCVLPRTSACANYVVRSCSRDSGFCHSCSNLPADGDELHCTMFECIIPSRRNNKNG